MGLRMSTQTVLRPQWSYAKHWLLTVNNNQKLRSPLAMEGVERHEA